MTGKLMDGREVSQFLRPYLQAHARELADRYRQVPALTAILVGDNAASAQYVRNKRKLAEELGFRSEIIAVAAAEATTERCGKRQLVARFNFELAVKRVEVCPTHAARIDAHQDLIR